MQVSEAMTRDVCVCGPEQTIRECAAAMVRNDIGMLPVADNNLLVGRALGGEAGGEGAGVDVAVSGPGRRRLVDGLEPEFFEHGRERDEALQPADIDAFAEGLYGVQSQREAKLAKRQALRGGSAQ